LTDVDDSGGGILKRVLPIVTVIIVTVISVFVLKLVDHAAASPLVPDLNRASLFAAWLPGCIADALKSRVLGRVEKLVGHHHLLVSVRDGCLPLVHVRDIKPLVVVVLGSARPGGVISPRFKIVVGVVLGARGRLSNVACSHLFHEVSVVHRLFHLLGLLVLDLNVSTKSVRLGEVEKLLFSSLAAHGRKNLLDSRVVR